MRIYPKYSGLVPPSIQKLLQCEAPIDRTTMSSDSVCQVAHSWVDVGRFNTRLVVRFMVLQHQSRIFWIHPHRCLFKLRFTTVVIFFKSIK
jgi:hypothetical protein